MPPDTDFPRQYISALLNTAPLNGNLSPLVKLPPGKISSPVQILTPSTEFPSLSEAPPGQFLLPLIQLSSQYCSPLSTDLLPLCNAHQSNQAVPSEWWSYVMFQIPGGDKEILPCSELQMPVSDLTSGRRGSCTIDTLGRVLSILLPPTSLSMPLESVKVCVTMNLLLCPARPEVHFKVDTYGI